MRKTSRTYKKSIRVAIGHFLSNRNGPIQAFYLTLPSNSSMQIYPTNTLTNFTTQLPISLFLDGDWEVGLAEIQYPYTWNNIGSGKNRACNKTLNERNYTSLEIPTGYYDNIDTADGETRTRNFSVIS